MTSHLGDGSRFDNFLNLSPILAKFVKGFEETIVFRFRPSSIQSFFVLTFSVGFSHEIIIGETLKKYLNIVNCI